MTDLYDYHNWPNLGLESCGGQPMNDNDIKLPPLPRPQVPFIDADIDLMDIRRLVDWCEKTAKEYARAAVEHHTAALRAEVERLQEIVRPKREDECLTLDHWRMRAYALEENWSRCSHACAVEQDKREQAEARAGRLEEALAELISWVPSTAVYRSLGFDTEALVRALEKARAALAQGQGGCDASAT